MSGGAAALEGQGLGEPHACLSARAGCRRVRPFVWRRALGEPLRPAPADLPMNPPDFSHTGTSSGTF